MVVGRRCVSRGIPGARRSGRVRNEARPVADIAVPKLLQPKRVGQRTDEMRGAGVSGAQPQPRLISGESGPAALSRVPRSTTIVNQVRRGSELRAKTRTATPKQRLDWSTR